MEPILDLEQLQQLISIVEANQLEELVFEEEGVEITIRMEGPPAVVPPPPGLQLPAPVSAGPPSAPDREEEGLVPVSAPIEGVFYRAPAPDDPPYVEEGDWVEPGQHVGVIEAMKIFNEIATDVGGRVVKIVVENKQMVARGEVLLWIDPRRD